MGEPDVPPGSVAIVGAGLAGCLLATLLGRRGIEVTLYERREDPRDTPAERGRSINLAISARGLQALEQVGLRELTLSRALPMHGRMVHTPEGQQSFRPYSADGTHAINSISRAELNVALLDVAARTPGVTLEFGCRLTDLDMATGELTFETAGKHHLPLGRTHKTARAGIVLACDGAYSAARRSVTFRQGFTFSQDYLEHGYKELTVPPRDGPDGPEFALDPDALHIWPRGASMMIALPNLDRSFTCTLFWTGAEFTALATPQEIRDHFGAHYKDVAGLIPNLVDDYENNPIGSLATIRCWPWVHHGEGCTLALVGDAAHAIVPFFGQGANCAFEDCVEIDLCLTDTSTGAGPDWTAALAAYQDRRKANCDVIADLALDNFIEMRDRVNSRLFQATTAARHALERRLPGRYVSRYELVSFTTMPYAQIPDRMRKQDRATALAAAGAAGVVAAAAAAAAALAHGRNGRNGRG